MASPATGLSGQIGYILEDTPGVPKTVTQFVPLRPGESLIKDVEPIKDDSIYAGKRMATSEQHDVGNIMAAGSVQHRLFNKGLEDIFTLMFGGVTKTGSGPYTRTYDARDMAGVSMTTQIGKPTSLTSGVIPWTFTGTKAMSWEIACAVGEYAELGLDLDAMNAWRYRTVADGVTTNTSTSFSSATLALTADDVGAPIAGTGIPAGATIATVTSATAGTLSAAATATATGVTFTVGKALATASYPASMRPFTFVQGAFSVAGTSVFAKKVSIKGTNGLDADRRGLGSRSHREAPESDLRTIHLTADVEYESDTHVTRFLAGSEVAAVLSFTAGADSLTLTSNAYYDKTPGPVIASKGVLRQTLELECVCTAGGGADSTAFQAVMVNSVA